MSDQATQGGFISTQNILSHWQGHRDLTRRMIVAYPEDQLFTFTLGGMRPFGELILEMLTMAAPMVRGVLSEDWVYEERKSSASKDELLQLWDENTRQINEMWPKIPQGRFYEHTTAFGQWPGMVSDLLLYVIDNEIHHRGQAYVYCRALGIEPPAFYERPGFA